METVELVIRIPKKAKEAFDKATKGEINGSYYDANSVIGNAIKNGTPLPKGHGRLIDESKIDYLDDDSERPFTFKDRIKNTSETIVEADKEGAE